MVPSSCFAGKGTSTGKQKAQCVESVSTDPVQMKWKGTYHYFCSAILPDGASYAQREFWNESLYKCSGCSSDLHPHKFDTTELMAWERTAMLHEAKCGNCDAGRHKRTKARTCNLCGVNKPWHAFGPAKQTTKASRRWRCKDCDCPACSSCGAIPMEPHWKPYMCSVCAFPPCSCGFPRPQSRKYRVSLKPTWQCGDCRQ